MKLKVNFEWRKKDEPELDPEFLVRTALKAAGYNVGHIEVQGVWTKTNPRCLMAHGTRTGYHMKRLQNE